MAEEYQLTLNDYLSILRRRAVTLAAVFIGILVIALTVTIAIPPVYQSTGTIILESQQIPTDFVPSTVNTFADERIEVIRQRVITRENLLKIIDKHGLFKDGGKSLTVSEKIDEMRKQIGLELISANVKDRRKQVTIAFKLSFEHRYPETAHKVANDLVTLFLDENVKARTERATETTEFLSQEAEKLKVELEKVEAQLAAYKQEHGNALPQHQELRMTMMSRTDTELKELEREYKAAQEELRFLDVELSAAKAGMATRVGGAAATRSPEDLASLKAEHTRLLSLYTEAHPDVRAVKRKIEALEAAGGSDKAVGAVSLDVARVQTKIAATQARADSLVVQVKALRARVGAYEQQILQSPQVERGLATLMRDHENARKKYEEIRAKQINAKIAENLEEENKAERFSLLEPPILPERPIRPDRIKILLIGLAVALGGSGGSVYMLETLNQRIRGEEALSLAIRQRPMLIIPYITTHDETASRKRVLKQAAITVAVIVLGGLVLLHFLYMPLDMLVLKIVARFG